MGIHRRRLGRSTIALAGTVAVLAGAGSAVALQGLPPGVQVNSDPGAGINPALNVSGEDPANADVVGGALTAGKPAVPWSVFRQTEASPAHDQIFSRSFAGGAWTTRGNGTVGGRSSGTPQFTGSLNFDQGQDGEAPAIDFAGAGRTVPWATWYEHTTGAGFDNNNIFASRFDATQNKWVFAGQGRGLGGGTVQVPSLNINTNQDAENPSVAGGSTANPAAPGPWITWQETSTASSLTHTNPTPDQIFVERPLGPGRTDCTGVTPAGGAPVGGFCFQQTGIGRFGTPTPDPTLNVDPTRNGVEPDIAFTGASDAVPWVVWYEKDDTGTTGPNQLRSNEMVFAAKGVTDTTDPTADGQIHWQVVGNNAQGELDATGTAPQNFGSCAANAASEANCSLNADPTVDAEDPRVASGTMNSANPTVPWVAWDELVGAQHRIFVSRLVGGTKFVIANNGQPISAAGVDATRPDITFSGNTPYVTWRSDSGGTTTTTVGHFVNAANPTFVVDKSGIPITPTGTNPGQADVREPISSGCTANPFNGDGGTCQGAAIGTPFFLFTNGTSPLSLFADAYQSDAPATGAATGVGMSTATLNGSVNPEGARTNVSFQFGTTTAYGQSTPAQPTGPDNAADAFSAAVAGLPAGTTIHYRAVATSDFGTQLGADQTLTTQSPPVVVPGRASVGHAKVKGTTVSVPISCKGDTSCTVSLKLTVTETLRGHKVIAVSARKAKVTHKTIVLGTASATIRAGSTATVKIGLNRTGRHLLAARHRLTAKLTVTQRVNGRNRTISTQKVTFKAPKPRHGGH
jgi:hypothetical protein